MNVLISFPKKVSGTIQLPLSKSECNRMLIIEALMDKQADVTRLSDAEDTQSLATALTHLHDLNYVYDIGPAGTSMRFLTALFAVTPGERVLTGSARMHKRPISILVKALRELGADIEFVDAEGFPPLRIKGGKLQGGEIAVDGSVSSQFISALLMIAPTLHNGLVINFNGPIVSRPYINMTLRIMERYGVFAIWEGQRLSVSPQLYVIEESGSGCIAEADWSAASYWYSVAALADEADLFLEGLKAESLQADAVTARIYPFLGVSTTYESGGVRITKNHYRPKAFAFDFEDCPDIVQTVAVTAAALQIPLLMRGLNTLRVKETDRIHALITELSKIGVTCKESAPGILELVTFKSLPDQLSFETYDDHRMAMSFAPLGCLRPTLISNHEVVRKSYPAFWDECKKIGAQIQ
jgi:3-phosphoshikimate 1-carboxyvinyltransferase